MREDGSSWLVLAVQEGKRVTTMGMGMVMMGKRRRRGIKGDPDDSGEEESKEMSMEKKGAIWSGRTLETQRICNRWYLWTAAQIAQQLDD